MSAIDAVTSIEVFKTKNGTVNLAFGFLTVCSFMKVRFTIMKSKAGTVYVNWPSQPYQKDNETKYQEFISFVIDEDRKTISSEIIKEYNKTIGLTDNSNSVKSSNQSEPTPSEPKEDQVDGVPLVKFRKR
jgi:hypothetical protein